MRATNDKLGERYITVVARELSKALKGLHDAGIMHRDIKGKLCGMAMTARVSQGLLILLTVRKSLPVWTATLELTCGSLV